MRACVRVGVVWGIVGGAGEILPEQVSVCGDSGAPLPEQVGMWILFPLDPLPEHVGMCRFGFL